MSSRNSHEKRRMTRERITVMVLQLVSIVRVVVVRSVLVVVVVEVVRVVVEAKVVDFVFGLWKLLQFSCWLVVER